MPYEDGTGPFGRGQITGRGRGRCARRQFGPLCWPAATLSNEEEAEMLEKQKAAIDARLKELK
ncbi:DUF5320 domain-containing protein [archaeon]